MSAFVKLTYYEMKKAFAANVVKYSFGILFILNLIICCIFTASYKETTVPAKIGNNGTEYEKDIQLLIAEAERNYNAIDSNTVEGVYAKEYQSEIISLYSDALQTVEISNEYIYGWDCYFAYAYDFIILLIFVLIFTSFLFHEDKNNGFIHICTVSKHGRCRTAAGKIAALFILCLGITLLFTITDLLIIGGMTGFSDGTVAVQSLKALKLVTQPISLMEYAIVNFLLKVFAVLLSAIIFAAIALFFGSLLYFLVSALYLVLEFALYQTHSISAGQWIHLNVFSFAHPQGILSRYRSVNWFGNSVDILHFMAAVFPVVICFLILLVTTGYARTKLIRIVKTSPISFRAFWHKRNFKTRPALTYPSGLGFYELVKGRWMYFLIIVLFVLKCLESIHYYTPIDSSYERMKSEYMAILEGSYSTEKEAFISDRLTDYANIMSQYDMMKLNYWDEKITEAEYVEYISDYTKAQGEYPVLSDLYDHAQYLKQSNGGWFLYDSGVVKFITQAPDYLLLICISCFCGLIFSCEFKAKTSQLPVMYIISTTLRGRRQLLASKVMVSLLTSCVVFVVFFIVDFFAFVKNYGLIPFEAPLSSIQLLGDAFGYLNFMQYFVIVFSLGLVGTCVLSLVFVNLSFLLKHIPYILIVLISALLLPAILAAVIYEPFALFGITNVIDGSNLIHLCATMQSKSPLLILVVPLASALLIAIGVTLITLRRLRK